MKKIISISILVFIFGFTKNSNTNSISSKLPSPFVYFGGELNTYLSQHNIGNTIYNADSLVDCYFVDANNNTGYGISAGNVSYNNSALIYNVVSYQDTTFLINLHQTNSIWNISGSAQVQSFSYAYTPSNPKFVGDYLLPNIISKTAGLSIEFGTSITNVTDSITITIGLKAVKKFPVSQGGCYFSPQDLINVALNNASVIELEFNNQRIITFNNRNYYINNRLKHTKYGVTINS
jgi:hypothetical protein